MGVMCEGAKQTRVTEASSWVLQEGFVGSEVLK